MGLHLYFGSIGGTSLPPGHYDFRAYIDKQVIRTICTIAPGESKCKKATGFDGNVKEIYGYVDIDQPGADIVELVMMRNEGRYTGGPEELLVRVVKDEHAEWGPLTIAPKYDRMTPADERCNVIDVSHTPIVLEFPPADPHMEGSSEGQAHETGAEEETGGHEDTTETDATDTTNGGAHGETGEDADTDGTNEEDDEAETDGSDEGDES